MPDINWGGDATSAPFKSRLDETDGNLVIAEDTDGETRLLEWDGTAWQVRGPVELNGEDVSGVGTLSATDVVSESLSTERVSIDLMGVGQTQFTSPESFEETNVNERQISLPNEPHVRLIIDRMNTEGSGQDIGMQFSDDGGSTFFDAGSADDYEYALTGVGSTTETIKERDNEADHILFADRFVSSGNTRNIFVVDLSGQNLDNRQCFVSWRGAYLSGSHGTATIQGSGTYDDRSVEIDTLKFFGIGTDEIDQLSVKVLSSGYE